MASGVLALHNDTLLMVKQHRRSGLRWEIPSGGQEPGESLEEVAVREAKEETGLSVDLSRLICTWACYRIAEASNVIGAVFVAQVEDISGLIPQTDDGILEAAFVNPHQPLDAEIGQLTQMMIDQYWPQRHAQAPTPFHLELWRDERGYYRR